jgi:hypothetical protein
MIGTNARTTSLRTIAAALVVATVPALAETPNLSGSYALTETQNCPFRISSNAVVNAGTLRQTIATLEFTPSAPGAQTGRVHGKGWEASAVVRQVDGNPPTALLGLSVNARYAVTDNKITINTDPKTVWFAKFYGLDPNGTASYVTFVATRDESCVVGGTLEKR